MLLNKLGKCAFVLAPICLFISFFADMIPGISQLRSVFLVLATIFLIIAVAEKIFEANRPAKEDKHHD